MHFLAGLFRPTLYIRPRLK